MKGRRPKRTLAGNPEIKRVGIQLHQILQRALARQPWRLAADLVIERLKAQGIRTLPEDRRAIEKAIDTNRLDQLRLKARPSLRKAITVAFTEADGAAIAGRMERATEQLPSIIKALLKEAVPSLLSTIRRTYPGAIRAGERRDRQQEANIARAWREPLASLALLIELACRMMRTVDDYCAEHPAAKPKLLHVLQRLHIRSVHVAREVLILLRSGYPDAAMARWRTLHEVATVMSFLSKHGEECAARYLEHQAVQAFEDASHYREAAARLGHRPPSDARYAKLRAARDAVVRRHGKPFGKEYGWAAAALKSQHPTFTAIALEVDRGHMRPYYRMASDNVHAGIMGALYKLGAVETGKLLLGPTPVGLDEAGQNTALSLTHVLGEMMDICPALDALVFVNAALSISDQAVEQFVSVGRSVKVTTDATRRRDRKRRSRDGRR